MTSSFPTRRFHVGEILSATTGTPVGRKGEPGLYDLVAFMVGLDRPIEDRELLASLSEVRPSLYRQVPGIEPIHAPVFSDVDEVEAWVCEQIAVLGVEEVDLEPLPEGHPGRDLSQEAVELRIARRVDEWILENWLTPHPGE